MDHVTAERVLQRYVSGLEVADEGLGAALEHAKACEICAPRFELGRVEASTEGEDMAEVPVEPTALFARALTAALAAPEAVARIRAAERLGTLRLVGPPALAALVRAAAEDPDASVRAAALVALDTLDDAVSLSERVIEAWSATPAEAERYLADVLQRLVDPLASPRVASLDTEQAGAGDELVVRGVEATGTIVQEGEELWLRLNGLPGSFEKTMPVVAVPAALHSRSRGIEWSGGNPGLVPSGDPVSEGSLDVYLGNVLPHESFSSKLFERLYLLDPRKRRI